MGTFLNQSLAVIPITLQIETRMHSSRMRTGRSLTVCCSLLPEGGSAPGGGLLLGGSAPVGGVCSWEGLPGRGGGVPGTGGVSARGGVCQHALRQTPPPVDRHTLVKILPWPNFVAAGNYISPLNIPRKVCMVRDAQMLQHYRALERIAIGAQ